MNKRLPSSRTHSLRNTSCICYKAFFLKLTGQKFSHEGPQLKSLHLYSNSIQIHRKQCFCNFYRILDVNKIAIIINNLIICIFSYVKLSVEFLF